MHTPSPYMNYTVAGMTCDHCVMSVREEVAEIPGVREIDVDLATGRLAVSGENVTDAAIAAAVAAAGYEVIA
jgi:copper chaperone